MLPGMEMLGCQIDVPASVMKHVVKIESSFNPFAIGVVKGRLARQPRNLKEAVATAEMLEANGFNFSLGLAQVNRYNLKKYGIHTYADAFEPCTNLRAGSKILLDCNERAGGHWGKSFSCYYSGNFTTGYRAGYVQKIERSMYAQAKPVTDAIAIPVISDAKPRRSVSDTHIAPTRKRESPPSDNDSLVVRRSKSNAVSAVSGTQPANTSSQPEVDEAFVF